VNTLSIDTDDKAADGEDQGATLGTLAEHEKLVHEAIETLLSMSPFAESKLRGLVENLDRLISLRTSKQTIVLGNRIEALETEVALLKSRLDE
jgi:hypothetical protein